MWSILRQHLLHLLLFTSFCIVIGKTYVGVGGLKFVRVQVPQYLAPGETAQMLCEYDLGNDTLYSVKWYKDHEEFYKWVPKAKPKGKSYKVPGVSVDIRYSNSKKVTLRNVSFETTGLYRCEVSAEAPSFSSGQSEANLEVISLPQEDPVITGEEDQYQINDVIDLNCTSGKSRPAPILHWYINEQKIASSSGALINYPLERHEFGLVSSILGLRFKLTNNHFLGGSMKVKCVASVQPVLWKGDSLSIVKSPSQSDMRVALLLVKSSCTTISSISTLLTILISVLLTMKT